MPESDFHRKEDSFTPPQNLLLQLQYILIECGLSKK
jgi:hypothetical protein